MKNHSSGDMIRVYQKLIDRLHAAGIVPKHHILSNECSDEFKETIKCNKITYQLVPPHNHRSNHTKKAILWQFSVEWTRSSLSIYGTYSYPKLRTRLTCFAHLG